MAILTNTKNITTNTVTILDSALNLLSGCTAYVTGVTSELSDTLGKTNQEAYEKGREHTRKAIDWTSNQLSELVNPIDKEKEEKEDK